MSETTSIVSNFRLAFVELVTIKAVEPDRRLAALLAKPTPLTIEEWAYLEAMERAAA